MEGDIAITGLSERENLGASTSLLDEVDARIPLGDLSNLHPIEVVTLRVVDLDDQSHFVSPLVRKCFLECPNESEWILAIGTGMKVEGEEVEVGILRKAEISPALWP
jgi:hypothetical protein